MISVFDVFKVGIGPSSSHTVGPMVAAFSFVKQVSAVLDKAPKRQLGRVQVTLFGSLAATGIGHGTDKAVLLGLMGYEPRTCQPDELDDVCAQIKQDNQISLAIIGTLPFNIETDLLFDASTFDPVHPNAMHTIAYDLDGMVLYSQTYYSIGGGFIQEKGEEVDLSRELPPFVFNSGKELLALCEAENKAIHELVLANELFWHDEPKLMAEIHFIWDTMKNCVEKGLQTTGILPGGLNLARRANLVKARLKHDIEAPGNLDFFATLDWVNAWALAVNEENAAGGRVVTAPTNGAAGIVPAVLKFAERTLTDFNECHIRDFLLTATAFGYLFKRNASISGAEVGCQGEVGSACAMAASGLAAVLGGTPRQIENAAEIATEHNLGLTCDPVDGLVQVPCIERNAIAAVKAINAARMALLGDGEHFVSFDKVVRTVRETGADMQSKYKETSQGGLAVNYTEC